MPLLLLAAVAFAQPFERTLATHLSNATAAAQAGAQDLSDDRLGPLAGDLPNFAKVAEWLYRGAQPTEEGFRSLKKLGVKTIVNLRDEPDRIEWEGKIAASLGLDYLSIPMSSSARPKDEDVERFLELAADYGRTPIFVHCMRGADRTGVAIAAYRIDFDHWGLKRTMREMLQFGAVAPRHIAYVPEFYRRRHPPEPKAATK